MFKWCKKIVWILMLVSFCLTSDASNPFLRPGANRPPPKVEPVPPPPKPVIDSKISKEVEFRGYFILNGVPRFCIFNKKSNFGEWIMLSEKTVEEFEALSFNMEEEKLTLAYSGQTFDLNLIESTSSKPSLNKANTTTGPPPKKPINTASSQPKIMPPRPSTVPEFPTWLASRMSTNLKNTTANGSPLQGFSKSNTTARIPPPFPSLTTNNRLSSPTTPNRTPLSNGTSQGSSINGIQGGIDETNIPDLQEDLQSSEIQEASRVGDDFDLDSLPPPPPPPNIVPPTGPPNIIPSKDD